MRFKRVLAMAMALLLANPAYALVASAAEPLAVEALTEASTESSEEISELLADNEENTSESADEDVQAFDEATDSASEELSSDAAATDADFETTEDIDDASVTESSTDEADFLASDDEAADSTSLASSDDAAAEGSSALKATDLLGGVSLFDFDEMPEFDAVYYNTGSQEYEILPAEALEYDPYCDTFDENGEFTIEIPEGNPFFPYEVQFTVGDDTWTEWFMTPESKVEVAGHAIGVSVMDGKYSSLCLHVAGEDVTVYPQEKSFSNNTFLLMSKSLSLMPLKEIELTVDLSNYSPIELTRVSSKAIFQGEEFDSSKIIWNKLGSSDSYTLSGYGDNFNLCTSSEANKWEMIVGEADQLSLDNTRYIVDIKTADFSHWLSTSLVKQNSDGERQSFGIQDDIESNISLVQFSHGIQSYIMARYGMTADSDSNIGSDDKIFISLGMGAPFNNTSTVKVYSGHWEIYNYPDASYDITSQIWGSDLTNGGGFELPRYESGAISKDITIMTEDENGTRTGCLTVYLSLNVGNTNPSNFIAVGGLKKADSSVVATLANSKIDTTTNYTIWLKENYFTTDELTLTLIFGSSDNSSQSGMNVKNDSVQYAFEGKYESVEAAESAGAKNIRNELFYTGYNSVFDEKKTFTVFADNIKYTFILDVSASKNDPLIGRGYYDTSTAVEFTGLVDRKGNSIDCYCVDSDLDSYGNSSYRTILVGKNVDISDIAPIFTTKEGVSLYSQGSTVPVISGKDYRDFSKGAVQYTAGTEKKDFQANYWLQIVKQDSKYNLFINSFGDKDSNVTVDENGVIRADREIIFTRYDVNYHDILIMNMGSTAIPNVKATLSSDMLALDQYWTLSGNHNLSGYSENDGANSQYGERSNIAKIRLNKKTAVTDGDTISGTLTITSGDETIAVITLKGTAGDPAIITDSVPDAVKYVHYATMIQNNVKYKWDTVSYSIVEGELPPGLEISKNGELYGVPEQSGTYSFTVRIDHSSDFPSTTKGYTLTVQPNTDENVDAATSEGYEVTERIPDFTGTPQKNYVFVSQGTFAEFATRSRVTIDGDLLILDKDYEAREGSTVITIYAQTLARGNGTHTISVEFRDKNDELHVAAQNYHISGMPEKEESGKTSDDDKEKTETSSASKSANSSYSESTESSSSANSSSASSEPVSKKAVAKYKSFTGVNTGVKGPSAILNATVKEAVQGPLAMAVFDAMMPVGFTRAMTFNLIVNGALNHDLKQGTLILDIDNNLVRKGRTFALIGIGLGGQPVIFTDIDSSNLTLTSDIELEGYAFALIYSDDPNAANAISPSISLVASSEYIVQSGDTLSKIARKLGTTVNDLVAKNSISNPDKIFLNQTIKY